MPTRALLLVVTVLATGCIGATDRAEFDAEIQRRGGGIAETWIDESLDLAAAEVGVDDTDELEITSLQIVAQGRNVTLVARRADDPQALDSIVIAETALVGVAPVVDADRVPIDNLAIRLGDLPLDRIEELVDVALAEFGTEGFVTAIRVERDGGPVLVIQLGSERRTATARFDAAGELIEVTR